MNKATVLTVIALLVLLAACGGKQMTAKPLAKSTTPTGEVVHSAPPTTVKPAASEPAKTAAQALKEFQTSQLQQTVSAGPKSGTTTFYGAPNATAKNKADARKLLLERTRAAFKSGIGVNQQISSSLSTTGARFYTSSGSAKNLPKDYESADND